MSLELAPATVAAYSSMLQARLLSLGLAVNAAMPVKARPAEKLGRFPCDTDTVILFTYLFCDGECGVRHLPVL